MIVVDGEMSGLNPKKNSLVSLGAVDFDNPDRIFYEECRVWGGSEIDPEALAVNGFSEVEVTDVNKQSLEELAQKFYEWIKPIKDRTICAQNVSTAIPRLSTNWGKPCGEVVQLFKFR